MHLRRVGLLPEREPTELTRLARLVQLRVVVLLKPCFSLDLKLVYCTAGFAGLNSKLSGENLDAKIFRRRRCPQRGFSLRAARRGTDAGGSCAGLQRH